MKRQGKPKGQTTVFKTHHKDTIDGISTKITSYIPNGLKSFTIELSAHWEYNGTESGLDALRELDKRLGKKLETYGVTSIWDYIIIDCDYPETPFRGASSFVEIQITTARRVQVTDYDVVAQPLLDLRDYVVSLIDEEFIFNEKKVKKITLI
jgi:hypothetical protein